jgi:hypothetical protein
LDSMRAETVGVYDDGDVLSCPSKYHRGHVSDKARYLVALGILDESRARAAQITPIQYAEHWAQRRKIVATNTVGCVL